MSEAWLAQIRDPNPWSAPRPLPAAIEVGSIGVRLYRKGDGAALFAAIDPERDSIVPSMAWATTDHRHVDDSTYCVERWIRAYERADCFDFPMAIVDRRTDTIIGGTGLHGIRSDLRSAEIGYWVRGSQQNKGICTQAIGALLSAALRPVDRGGWGLRRIVIFNDVENVASRRVCEKLGLRLEMRLRKERYHEPRYRDFLGFAVLADEWDYEHHRAKPGIGWE